MTTLVLEHLQHADSASPDITIDSNGRVGIGTTSPDCALDVTRTSGWAEMHLDGAAGGDLILKDNGVSYGEIYAGNGHGMVLKSYTNQHMHFLTDANATAKMTILANGNVGIGTDSPNTALEIAGGQIWVRQDSGSSTGRGLQFGYAGNHGSYRSAIKGGPESYGVTDSGILTFHTQNGYVVSDTPPERMRIDSNGNLLFNGNGVISVQSSSNNMYIGGGSAQPTELNLESGTLTKFKTNGSEAMRIDSSGRLLLGTSTSFADVNSDDLQISGSSDTGMMIKSGTSSYGSIYFGDATSGGARNAGIVRYKHGDDNMQFWTAEAERVRIDSNGNLLVGKTTSGQVLTKGVQLGSAGSVFATTDSANNSSYFVNLATSGTRYLQRFYGGSTLVGNISTDNNDLSINGTANHSGIRFQEISIMPLKNGASSNGDIDLGYNDGTTIHAFRNLTLSGGVYLGGTGAANKLDDYEEGTWTPTDYLGNALTLNNGSAAQKYTKIGRQVFLDFDVTGTASTSGSQIRGLPFTAPTSYGNGGNLIQGYANGGTPANTRGHVYNNALYMYDGSTAVSWLNGRRLIGTIVYAI